MSAPRRKWFGTGSLRLCLGLAITLWALPAVGQEAIQFEVVRFKPAISSSNYFITTGAETLPHLSMSAALYLNYAHQPLQLLQPENDDFQHALIRYQLGADLLLGIGLFKRYEIGLGLPVILAQSSEGLEALGRPANAAVSGGMGDLRLIPKVRIFTKKWAMLGFAAPLSFPTGSRSNMLGDKSVTFTPQLIGGVKTKHVTLAMNLGYRFRADQTFTSQGGAQQVIVDDEVPMSMGIRLGPWKRMALIGDLFWAISTRQQDREEIPVELLSGLRFFLPKNFIANVGVGAGLTQGVGTPAVRILGGIAYHTPEKSTPAPTAPALPLDPDHDGILGDADKCPDDPEDRDDFEDQDGCPDLDNDQDDIPDKEDKCPLRPEDRDNFEDQDGCPDLDNDQDGVLDKKDRCPLQPEDRDNFEDQDGCPDLDNDQDGIPDKEDKCPLQPEVFNAFEDEDGCPDVSKGPVNIQHGKITVPSVFFAVNKDRVLKRSLGSLNQVAQLLQKNTWIKQVSIEGHTDSRGKDSFNLDLSQRRAHSVREHLIGFGADANRLTANGLGEQKPIASNRSARGRAKNRRVEFVITDPINAQLPTPTSDATP